MGMKDWYVQDVTSRIIQAINVMPVDMLMDRTSDISVPCATLITPGDVRTEDARYRDHDTLVHVHYKRNRVIDMFVDA